MLARQQ